MNSLRFPQLRCPLPSQPGEIRNGRNFMLTKAASAEHFALCPSRVPKLQCAVMPGNYCSKTPHNAAPSLPKTPSLVTAASAPLRLFSCYCSSAPHKAPLTPSPALCSRTPSAPVHSSTLLLSAHPLSGAQKPVLLPHPPPLPPPDLQLP